MRQWAAAALSLIAPGVVWLLLGGLPPLKLSPPSPTSIDDLYALTHPPGPAETRWFKDGERQPSLDGRGSVSASQTRKGQTWRVEIGDRSAEATIRNLPPFAFAWVSPDPPGDDDDITLNLEGRAIDEDPLEYRIHWTVDGAPAPEWDGAERIPASATSPGQTWEVEVTPTDGEDDGDSIRAGALIDGGQAWGALKGEASSGRSMADLSPTPFEGGLALAWLIALIVRFAAPRSEAGVDAEAGAARDWTTPLVFGLGLLGLALWQTRANPMWVPSGSDADSWYQSAIAMRRDVPYPPNRWPLYAWLVALLDVVAPGPMFVQAQAASMAATAAAAAALYRAGRWLIGVPGALAVAAATLCFPQAANVAGWTSAYALWAAGGVIAAAGLVEGMRAASLPTATAAPSGRLAPLRRALALAGPGAAGWATAGLGLTIVLATMEKGLAMGVLLGPLLIAGWAWSAATSLRRAGGDGAGGRGRALQRAGLGAAAGLAPLALFAAIYAGFPIDLMTLDAQVSSPYLEEGVSEGGPPAPPGPTGPPPGAGGPGKQIGGPPGGPSGGQELAPETDADLTGDGYVFGQSMSPGTIWTTFKRIGSGQQPGLQTAKLTRTLERLHKIWPDLGSPFLLLLVGGGGIGLISGAWRGAPAIAGWLAVAMVCGGVLPSVASEFNMRFLHPMVLVTPLLLLAPLGALTARRRGLARWAPVILLPVILLPGSPWTGWSVGGEALTRTAGPDTVGVTVYHHLRDAFPDAILEVTTPGGIALVALDGREGTFYANDRRFFDVDDAIALDPSRYVLRINGGGGGGGGGPGGSDEGALVFTGLEGRQVVATWPIPPDPAGVDRSDSAGAGLQVELLGPVR